MPIPASARAILDALRFGQTDKSAIRSLHERDWESALRFCDQSQLTLLVGAICGEHLPAAVRRRIEDDACKNAQKFARLKSEFFTIADALEHRGIEFVTLKGFTHSPDFTTDPLLRSQGDIDLWFERDVVYRANAVLLSLGYAAYCETEDRHLPPLIRRNGWVWNGDYHDPGAPIGVDLHYQLWDAALEKVKAPGIEDFWDRRTRRLFDERPLWVLHPADALAFSAVHQLMHVLRGDARLQRAWEIASFLENRKDDAGFWNEWREMHPERLRLLETVVFRMCAEWFGCELSSCVREELERAPSGIRLWLDRHGGAPVENLFEPNKNELWLHLALADSASGRLAVLRRRLVPLKRLHENQTGRLQGLRWSLRRAAHHARVLPATLIEGARWWWLQRELGRPFLKFLLASAFFDLGAFVFFVLYNLYLLDLGYHEKFLGLVSGSMTAGTLAAALPAAFLARRLGIRGTLLVAILGGAGASLLRVAATAESALLVAAFLHGGFFSLWAVCLSPAIASLSTEKNRSFAFSLVFAAGIGIGAVGGLVGGYLPRLFSLHPFLLGATPAKRASLILSCLILALAAPAAAKIHLPRMPRDRRKTYPRSPFVLAFLSALFVWTFATGAFNPFFNAYFAGPGHLPVERIGLIYAAAQLTQVGAVLLAPLCFRRIGEVNGVASMQFMTAAALAALAMTPAGWPALVLYPLYMAFQYMSLPGLSSMLMTRVGEREREGASAMNFVITSLAGMLAAFASGAVISRYGYPVMMGAAAALAALAALLFRGLIHDKA
ncbi:MAG TPA: MFS transporter [Bryobacteraceae bacterium]|nr:MFS transporter [Bryobacteraceae bacterium]